MSEMNNNRYISRVYTQNGLDDDWASGDLKVNLKYPDINVDLSSSHNKLNTLTPIETGENVLLYNSTDGMVKNSNINVIEPGIDTTSDVDILKDGSGVALWKLDGNANDVGGEYNGIWHGNEQYEIDNNRQVAKFDGEANWIYNEDINLSSFTISFFIKLDDLDDARRIFFFKDANGNLFHLVYDLDYGTSFNFHKGEGTVYPDAKLRNVEKDVWYHIAINNNSEVYINGIKRDTIDNHTSHWAFNNRKNLKGLHIGNSAYYDYYYYSGLIKQVRIFNRALTADEIQKIYSEESGKFFNISISGLTQAPEKAWLYRNTKIALDIAQSEQDLRIQDIELTKESSSTTQFIGTSTEDIKIKPGDILLIDNSEIVISDITKENNSGIYRYTLTFPEQTHAPETVIVHKKSKELNITEANMIYEDDSLTHNPLHVDKIGKTIQYSIQTDKDVIVDKISLDLKKEKY